MKSTRFSFHNQQASYRKWEFCNQQRSCAVPVTSIMLRNTTECLINQLKQVVLVRSAHNHSQFGAYGTGRRGPFQPRPEMRTIKPVDPSSGKKKKMSATELARASNFSPQSRTAIERKGFDGLDPEVRDQILNLDDDDLEPNVETIGASYDLIKRERQALYLRTQRWSATRKHYKDLLQARNEPSLLTYAEKEKIKYLYSEENWTPEMVADSFPISESGAKKLLGSKPRWCTDKEILEHDQLLVERLRAIEAGEIEVNADMEESLMKRSAQTLFVGARWNPEGFVDGEGGFDMENKPKKEPGEFESLVIIKPEKKKGKVAKQLVSSAQSAKTSSSESEESSAETSEKSSPPPPPAPDSFGDELEGVRDIRNVFPDYDGGEEERRFKTNLSRIDASKRITFAEFQKLVKSNQ